MSAASFSNLQLPTFQTVSSPRNAISLEKKEKEPTKQTRLLYSLPFFAHLCRPLAPDFHLLWARHFANLAPANGPFSQDAGSPQRAARRGPQSAEQVTARRRTSFCYRPVLKSDTGVYYVSTCDRTRPAMAIDIKRSCSIELLG